MSAPWMMGGGMGGMYHNRMYQPQPLLQEQATKVVEDIKEKEA